MKENEIVKFLKNENESIRHTTPCSIQRYITCNECEEENVNYVEQGLYRSLGFTEVGFEVFCERHKEPIISFDFRDVKGNLQMIYDVLNRKCSCCGDSSSHSHNN